MWTGPWTITSEPDDLHIRIADKKGKMRDVSLDRLKIFKSSDYKNTETWNEYQKSMELAMKNQPTLSDNDED